MSSLIIISRSLINQQCVQILQAFWSWMLNKYIQTWMYFCWNYIWQCWSK